MHSVSGEQLTGIDLGEKFVSRYGAPWVTLHRNELLQILREACLAFPGVSLETGKHVVEIEDSGALARAHCADGACYEGAGLLVADGVGSKLRSLFSADERFFPATSISALSCPGRMSAARRPAAMFRLTWVPGFM
jgi:salicylate hydroxylase